jgi:glycosyltransferase involved in cell wall biosynthesis
VTGLGQPAALPGFSHIELSYVTTFYFNQTDSSSLLELLRRYASYSGDLLDRLQFLLVDDGSPVPVRLPADLDLNVLFLRIPGDVPWNHAAARNLGAVYARSDKLLLTDVDHEFPEDTLRRIVGLGALRRTMYMFDRLDERGAIWKRHSNTFLLSRGRYLELFGYDEEFCGDYGLEDDLFRLWHRHHGTRIRVFPGGHVKLRPVDREGSYHSLPRDRSHNAEVLRRKRRLWEERGPRAASSRIFLRAPFEVVADLRRAAPPPPCPPPSPLTRLWRRWQWLGATRRRMEATHRRMEAIYAKVRRERRPR